METADNVQPLNNPQGSGKYWSVSYLPTPKINRITGTKIHIGEIIIGNILEVISQNEALIGLPNGNFHSRITGRFKKGDSLLLKVVDTNPSLVLKIYGVYFKKDNVYVDLKELLRILDLPDNDKFYEIIKFIRGYKQIAKREELVNINHALNKLDENEFKKYKLTKILTVILFILDNHLHLNNITYSRIKNVLNNSLELEDALNNLFISFRESSDEILKKLYKEIYSNMISGGLKTRLKLLDMCQAGGIYNLLIDLLMDDKNCNIFSNERKQLINTIISHLESYYLFNTMANIQNTFVILPVITLINNRIKLYKLRFKSRKLKLKGYKPITFSLMLSFLADEEVEISVNNEIDNMIDMTIYADRALFNLENEGKVNNLKRIFNKYGYELKSMDFQNTESKNIDVILLNSNKQSKISTII